MNTDCNLRNENGYVLITSMMVLGLLTFLGITSSTTSTLEQQIAGNSKEYSECFYVAEASAIEAAQNLENTDSIDLKEGGIDWINNEDDFADGVSTLEDPSEWDMDGQDGDDNAVVSALDTASVQLAVSPVNTAVHFGVAGGSSLSLTESTVHRYSTFGMCDSDSEVLIEIGYRIRY